MMCTSIGCRGDLKAFAIIRTSRTHRRAESTLRRKRLNIVNRSPESLMGRDEGSVYHKTVLVSSVLIERTAVSGAQAQTPKDADAEPHRQIDRVFRPESCVWRMASHKQFRSRFAHELNATPAWNVPAET